MSRRGRDVVALRYLLPDGRISRIKPMRVVEDSEELVVLYIAAGTPMRIRVWLDGRPVDRSLPYRERFVTPWRLGDGRWRGSDVLQLTRPGCGHSFWAFFRDSAFEGWYVNLQAPLRRTTIGFDTSDHVLDVRVGADRRWAWKDEDEFAEAIAMGRFAPEEAEAIRAEGTAAAAAIEAGAWPFDGGWEQWRPDPTWTVPDLDAAWEGVPPAA